MEADLIASIIQKSNGNIQGTIQLMDTFPLGKIRKIMDFWNEITLPLEDREKRVRSEGDKEAQHALENLMQGKLKPKVEKQEPNADPATLDRFLGLGVDLSMMNTIKPHKKEN